MKFVTFVKTRRFYIGCALFSLSMVVALVSLPSGFTVVHKLLIGALGVVLYTASQFYTSTSLAEDEAKEQTQERLRCVDVLKFIDPGQNLRSNVFRWNPEKETCCIWAHHNMDTDPAKNVTEIGMGEGCTGSAWKSTKQILAGREEIFEGGKFALSRVQEDKISCDLQWICSTPIMHPRKKKVIGVLNLDGNKPVLNKANATFIKGHAERLATELAGVLSRL